MHRPALGFLALIALLVATIATQGVATAQTATPGAPGPTPTVIPTPPQGTFTWAFGNENPFFDSRVAGALGTAMEPFIRTGALAGTSYVRVEAQGPNLRPATVYPAGDVSLLLRAAGYGSAPPFIVVGSCRIWSASPAVELAVPRLNGALVGALAGLGVTVPPCTATTNPAEAHILAWRQGVDPAPPLPQRNTPTFLGAPNQGTVPGGAPSAGNVPVFPAGSSPRPATTGTAGLEAHGAAHPAAQVLLLAFGAMMVLGGRRLIRRA